MTLPRFTSGNIGRLSFANVNEICEVAERARDFLAKQRTPQGGSVARPMIWAHIEGNETDAQGTPGAMRFYELELSRVGYGTEPRAPEWKRKTNGIETGTRLLPEGGANPDYQPCFSIRRGSPPHLANLGGLCQLQWIRADDGRGYWFVVDREPQAEAFPARIAGNQAIAGTSPTRYRYAWKEIRGNATFSPAEDFPGQMVGHVSPVPEGSEDHGYALNGAEFAPIPSVSNGAIVGRRVISTGEVVHMAFDVDGFPWFHARNDYTVECAP